MIVGIGTATLRPALVLDVRLHWVRSAPGEDGPMWKHRYRRPTGAARVLLAMVRRDPFVVVDVLS